MLFIYPFDSRNVDVMIDILRTYKNTMLKFKRTFQPIRMHFFCILVVNVVFFHTTLFAQEVIIINETQGKSERNRYTQELLVAALNNTIDSHGRYKIEILPNLNQPRTAAMLRRREGYGDIVQGATRKDWEEHLIPIEIPIMKGALGLRVMLIRQDMQATFSSINSIEELKQQIGGTVNYWSITKVFDYHKFSTAKTNRQDSLFAMLEKKRFDYISRGITEVLIEYQEHKLHNPNLHIEEDLLMYIPLPVYFFVTPTKPHLAERLEAGLKRIMANGTLDTIFSKHFKERFMQLNLLSRKVFKLENPNLTSPYYSFEPEELRKLFESN